MAWCLGTGSLCAMNPTHRFEGSWLCAVRAHALLIASDIGLIISLAANPESTATCIHATAERSSPAQLQTRLRLDCMTPMNSV